MENKELTEEMLNKPNNFGDTVTYTTKMLVSKTLDYDIVLDSGVKLQRDFVWSLEQKQSFIMSMIKGIEIPNIYVYDYSDIDDNQTIKIIDGKQRISTLIDYYNGKFPVVVDGVEYYFDNLHKWLRSRVANRPIKTVIFYGYYDDKISDNDLIDIFTYVNFTGTPQEKSHLDNLLKHRNND